MQNTSIIIVTYNHLDYTKDCIESIKKYSQKGTYEIIVIDNSSTDGTKEWLKEQSNLKIILNDENLGFPKACNQGIAVAEKENDILLLNNDTIVTKNWLDNLKICLNSNPKIGAVGAVSNHNENDQGCDFSYDDFEQMQQLAEINNISDASRWEEKVFLIGFCLLIKRNVINEIKFLDENYTPGYIEDNALSLEIIKRGYHLVLCHDVFIHHYLGTEFRKDLDKFYKILNKNRNYFINCWGFNTFTFDDVKNASLKILQPPKKILEFNCGIGTTILKLKYKYKNSIVHGIEPDKAKKEIAKHFTTVYETLDQVKDYDYDCILIGDILEKVLNPKEFLNSLKKYLKDGGDVVGEISNIASIENIEKLLNDSWYFINNSRINHYTISDIKKLLEDTNYKLNFTFSWYKNLNTTEKTIIEKLNSIVPNNYETVYYSFRFTKM